MPDHLSDILKLNDPDTPGREVISLIGGGGKTSLMFSLAGKLARVGKTVLCTTTTKIFMPGHDESPDTIIAGSIDELINKAKVCLTRHNHFSAASAHDKAKGKLLGFSPDIIDQLHKRGLFDLIIVEADGARQKPHKTTDLHEPVLPGATTHLILVTGLDVVGKPLDSKYVHRAELFSKNHGLSMGGVIDEQSIAKSIMFEINKGAVLCHPGLITVFLNKADNSDKTVVGKKISKLLSGEKSIDSIITASIKNETFIKLKG